MFCGSVECLDFAIRRPKTVQNGASVNWIASNLGLIFDLTINHVRLAIIPILLGFVIAVPLGWVASRNRVARTVIVTTGSLLYTIPSLPLFVILPVILGTRILDDTNLVVALTIYAVAIMLRSATDAFGSVDRAIIESAKATGFSRGGRFWRVEFPLAGPVLIAGLRVVSVSTIALVSVGVIIGSENLGYLFQNGKQRGILEEVVVGIVMSLLIALVFDLILVAIGRILMPWSRVSDRRSRRGRSSDGEPDADADIDADSARSPRMLAHPGTGA
ncbi:Choline transport system permease protein OpuBB [Microbacterium foliorum]|uniref:Choline transport system permease protein OpuBB n=1 Tax=Microbacterium foliorum TaxID=104336 RepID=A0A0F0KJL1_9MICO|nr:Choline transport system permease protein OpuBB [Microbacterium foliorum]